MELGYWGIKGIAEPIRWLIGYLALPIKETNPATREEWHNDKKNALGLAFPNLPYLIDGDTRITESGSIPYYLAHKAGKPELFGKDWKEQSIVRELEGVLNDVGTEFRKIFSVQENHKAALEEAVQEKSSLMQKVAQLSKFLGEKDFFLGHLTWADFRFAYMAELLWAVSTSLDVPAPLMKHQNLIKLGMRIHELPGVKERVQAAKTIPFMPPGALKFNILNSEETEAKFKAAHAGLHK